MAIRKKTKKNIPLKHSLLYSDYVPLPRWLIQAMGLKTAVYLCGVIDFYNSLVMSKEKKYVKQLTGGKISIQGKKFIREYDLSYAMQKKSLNELRAAKMLLLKGQNTYGNKQLRIKQTWCWVNFEILKRLNEEWRPKFFKKLKTSEKFRSIIQDKIETSGVDFEVLTKMPLRIFDVFDDDDYDSNDVEYDRAYNEWEVVLKDILKCIDRYFLKKPVKKIKTSFSKN